MRVRLSPPVLMNERDIKRFLSKIYVTESGCWEWTGHRRKGYGQFSLSGKSFQAHRVSLFLFKEIMLPDTVQVDHQCKNHPCVNPDHLEIVSSKQNTLRGIGPTAKNARKTHCVNGHELTLENTYIRPDDGARECRTCNKIRKAAFDERRRLRG